MITITTNDGSQIPYKQWLFPGGEVGVKLIAIDGFDRIPIVSYRITARLHQHGEIIELAMLVDALKRFNYAPIHLVMPYVPYGRQDRVCDRGEALSLKVFANMINAMGFASVTVFDPHSDVTGALLQHLRVITQKQIIHQFDAFIAAASTSTLISPDAGAIKKVSALASYLEHREVIRADKLRDLATGEITGTVVYANSLEGRRLIIVDDICDGGRTFIELAKALKAKGACHVSLYVTHGIFSKGLRVLFDGGIDHIFTTDSWGGSSQHDLGPNVTTLAISNFA